MIKKSKCHFGQTHIDYLGHIFSAAGVKLDLSKIQSILDWPELKTLKSFRGFLGLNGYYRKFPHYAKIAKPLTNLLKKDSFL